jgi:hypothetical protein
MDDGTYSVQYVIMEEPTLNHFDLHLTVSLVIQADHPVEDAVCIIPMFHMSKKIAGCYRGLILVYFHSHIAQVGTD